jgi:hypothetical protein
VTLHKLLPFQVRVELKKQDQRFARVKVNYEPCRLKHELLEKAYEILVPNLPKKIKQPAVEKNKEPAEIIHEQSY